MPAALAAVLLACAATAALEAVPPGALRVTEGALVHRGAAAEVEGPRLRAEAPGRAGDRAELLFTWLGPPARDVALASGELRRQVALKLRAQDACNLVYVSWRFAPTPGIAVQVKRNGGKARSAECGAGGYTTVRPRWSVPVAAVLPGAPHSLAAEIDGDVVRVFADGEAVLEAVLPPEAAGLHGPPGMRTDNVRAMVELRAAAGR